MKRLILISIGFVLLLGACEEKFNTGDFVHSDIQYTDSINIPSFTDIGKRGIYMKQIGSDWSANVSSLQPHWHYSESSKRSIKEPGNIDFVPMIADSADLDAELYEYLFKLKDQGQLLNLLSFNEPDDSSFILSVDEAINAWPELEQFDVPLGSPLCLDISGTWINDFMIQAENGGLRVDYIVMQWYGKADAAAFLKTIDSVYSAFNKPVWIAKFAPINSRLSEVKTFIETVIPELDSRDHVFRYAWDPGELNTPTAFWDAEGNLTPRGQYYADYNPNYFVSLGRDDWIDISALKNLVVDGGFESGTLENWGGYGTEIVVGEDVYSGEYSGMAGITGWSSGSAINYPVIEVDPENTYYLSFAARLTSEITAPANFTGVSMLIRDPDDNTLRYFRSDPIFSVEWNVYSYQVYIPENVTKIMLVCWRPQKSPSFQIDDLFFAKLE